MLNFYALVCFVAGLYSTGLGKCMTAQLLVGGIPGLSGKGM